MGYFVGKLVLEEAGSKHWKVLEELIYVADAEFRITVPRGFITDGASIPRGFWSLIGHPLNGKHASPAVVHDYLYVTQAFDKDYADRVFLEAMKAKGVSFIRRHLMYYAVKFFGTSAWNSYKKKD